MSNDGISTYQEKDSILNIPGHFFFQITSENEYKLNKNPISKKFYDEIKFNLINIFKSINESLKRSLNSINPSQYSDLYTYYSEICSKLDRFCDNSKSRGFSFPGLQVISLGSKQLETFAQIKEKILICEKSDGVRYLLIHFANDKHIMLGRNLEFYYCDFTVKLPNIYNTGGFNKQNGFSNISHEWEIINLLDGELIVDEVPEKRKEALVAGLKKSKNSYKAQKSSLVYIKDKLCQIKFVVFDAIMINKTNIGMHKFKDRINELANFFSQMKVQIFSNEAKEKFLNLYSKKMDYEFKEKLSSYSQDQWGHSHCAASQETENLRFKIDIYLKDYFTFDKIKFLYEKIAHNLLHENDGIILNLDDYPYYSGQSTEIFKWKPQSLNTVDFEVETRRFKIDPSIPDLSQKDNLENMILLKLYDPKVKWIFINILLFESKEEEKKFISEYAVIRNSNEKVVIECHFEMNQKVFADNAFKFKILKDNNFAYVQNVYSNSKFAQAYKKGFWKFMRFRRDKLTGNSLHTFFKVWESIEDDLTIPKIQEKLDF